MISYPNPATNQVTIETKMNEECSISIINMNGQVVLTQKSAGTSSVTLDLSKLSKSLYMIEVKSAKQIISKKLVIQ